MKKNDQHILAIPPDTSDKGYFIGTAGFDYKDWAGGFYPTKASVLERLDIYQAYFSFLELSCYLNEPHKKTFEDLARALNGTMECSVRVPKRIACPKVWQPNIGLRLLGQFVDAVYPLFEAGRLYSLVFPVDENTVRSERILNYLIKVASAMLHHRIATHIEFRHKSWHTTPVLQALKDNGLGICNVEIPVNSAFPLGYYATTEKGYVRYCGRNYKAWKETVKLTKKECFDYDYRGADIETMVQGQIRLGKKVSTSAVVFGNVGAVTGVGNAIQNALMLDHAVRMEKVVARSRRAHLSGAKSIKIT